MKSFTVMPQGFDKCTKATLQINYFSRTNTMIASALKHDHDIIMIISAESPKLF